MAKQDTEASVKNSGSDMKKQNSVMVLSGRNSVHKGSTKSKNSRTDLAHCKQQVDQKCLVVNDDQFSLKITSMLLECSRNEHGKDFSILNAVNGKEAVEIYKTTSNIKLILMDIEMPIMDGYDATKKIREYEEQIKNGKDGGLMVFIIGVSGNSNQ